MSGPFLQGEHLPFKCVFAFGPEVVHVGLEVQLEHVVLVDVLGLRGNGERIAKQGQAGQGVIVLGRPIGGGIGEVAIGVEPGCSLLPCSNSGSQGTWS